MGYVLPWGNMSFWGAKVIISLFGAVPFIGDAWCNGSWATSIIADATLNRFFALHVIALPLVLLLLVVRISRAARSGIEQSRRRGNQEAEGRERQSDRRHPFHPYYTVKDLFGVGIFLLIFAGSSSSDRPSAAGFWKTTILYRRTICNAAEIKPVWYFTPFYAILRVIPFGHRSGRACHVRGDRCAVPRAVARSLR